jgi:endoglycosylceramidase
VVAAVRAAQPGWVAFLEPSSSRNEGIATGLTAFDFPNVMYAPHSYDQSAEAGNGFDPSHRQMILDNVGALEAEAKALHAGLWIGEYGGVATAPGIADYMTAQYDAAGLVAGSTMYWADDKGDGYALLDSSGNEKPALLGALVRPYPERVAGDPLSYAFDAASSTFTLAYRPDLSSKLPTEIVVPERTYPNGYRVECGGCQYQMQSGELLVESPPAAGPAMIVLHP